MTSSRKKSKSFVFYTIIFYGTFYSWHRIGADGGQMGGESLRYEGLWRATDILLSTKVWEASQLSLIKLSAFLNWLALLKNAMLQCSAMNTYYISNKFCQEKCKASKWLSDSGNILKEPVAHFCLS